MIYIYIYIYIKRNLEIEMEMNPKESKKMISHFQNQVSGCLIDGDRISKNLFVRRLIPLPFDFSML